MVATEYNQCVEAYADKVYRFVLKIGAPESVANTIVQECFTALWNRRNKIDSKAVKSFLLSEAYSSAMQKGKLDSAPVQEPTQKSTRNSQGVLDVGLQKIQPQQRALLILRDYEGYSYEEIGTITGLQETSVKNEMYRARKLLKTYLVSSQFNV